MLVHHSPGTDRIEREMYVARVHDDAGSVGYICVLARLEYEDDKGGYHS